MSLPLPKDGQVTIYYKTYCPYSIRAVELLRKNMHLFKQIIEEPIDKRGMETMEVMKYITEQIPHGIVNVANAVFKEHRTVPIIFIGYRFIGGFDDLSKCIDALINHNKLKTTKRR